MKYINKIRNFYIPFDYPKFALVISIAALAFAASSHNTPCISAQSTCSVGSDNEFSGNISLKGGTAYKSTFDASGITADRTLTIPNNTGTLALTSDIPSSSYTPDAPFLKADATGAATSGTATADAPFVSVDASGQLDSSATLTASTPLKSSATGQITASDLDITTDITPGAALTQIRTNAAGNALEYFTPTSGGAYTLIDSGTLIANSSSADEVFTCWYGNTLDSTKRYKLIADSGTGFNVGANGYIPQFRILEGDCSTGTKNIWESSSYYGNSVTTTGEIDNDFYRNRLNKCVLLNSNNGNTSSLRSSNIQAEITFTAVDNGNDYGFSSQHQSSGVVTNGSGFPTGASQQQGYGSCTVWDSGYTNSFSDITGFMFYFEGGFPAPLTKNWSLYEIDY